MSSRLAGWLVLLLLLLATALQAGPQAPSAEVADAAPGAWSAEAAGRSLACRALPDGDHELRVTAGEREVCRLVAERFELLRFAPGGPAADLDGDGTPELVVAAWEGRRCRLWALEGARARPLPGWHAPGARLTDLDGDGVLELVTRDETFAGWRGWSQAEAPGVEVVLQRVGRGGLWRVAPELRGVARPDPRALQLQARALARAFAEAPAGSLPAAAARAPQASVRATRTPATGAPETGAPETGAPETGAPATGASETGALADRHAAERALTAALLELHATGHADLAPALLAAAWPARRTGRDAFWRHFRARLRLSPYLGTTVGER